jgi:hypothetical protein
MAANRVDWVQKLEEIGTAWRREFGRRVPNEVSGWWQTVLRNAEKPLQGVLHNEALCEALLQLCAASDEACAGAGIPGERASVNRLAEKLLIGGNSGSTLCREIHQSKLRVLPKQHAPRSGITIRSISHHLSLCPSADVVPRWFTIPAKIETHSLNILLVPWPKKVVPAQFKAASPPVGQLLNMDAEKYGFFAFDPEPINPKVGSDIGVLELVKRAETIVGPIDGVVLPELAVTPKQHRALRERLVRRNCFLICGIASRSTQTDKPGENYLAVDIPLSVPSKGTPTYFEVRQSKHHRWRLDRSQIVQYGLGAQLDPTKEWWEHISLGKRELNFITARDWLTLCVLVCEDLARPDPVGDIVRAVGPNLLVALLMDGPQLGSRWPGRYATVLADDPGSSVLTLSSAGMVDLCRPPIGAHNKKRTVALWKDARNREAVEIDLPQGADAIVVTLTCDKLEELTADGRSDGGQTAYPVLSGVQPIFNHE